MIRMPRKYLLFFLVIIIFIDITYSHDNDSSTESQRHGRVSGRIVKLYTGPKPDPILCTSEGFLADDVDCSVFYRCLKANNGKYTVYRFQCGPGTVYDPDTEICNHPRNTKRSQCGGLNNNKVLSSTEPYIENEIDGWHKENQELPSPISSKPPKVSSTVTNLKPVKFESTYISTTYPWLSTSNRVNRETTSVSTATSYNIPNAVSTKNPWEYSNAQTTYYFPPQPSIRSDVQCTADGFMGDSEDCRKFYRCVNNQRGGYLKYEFSCSDSTIWDDDTQACNHPWAVQRRRCGKGNSYNENSINFIEQIKNEETPNNIIQQQTQVAYGTKVTQTQTQISTGSVKQNQTQIHFGDRLNLDKVNIIQNQTQIIYGSPISESQSQFNYGNEVTQAQVEIDHTNKFIQSQGQILNNIVSSTTTLSTPSSKDINSNGCTTEGFMGDPNDCKKFYRCTGNGKGVFTVHEFSCTEGTLWDNKLEACNHAWAVKECGGKKNNQSISPITIVPKNNTFTQYTTTSTSFYNNEIDEIGYGSQNSPQKLEPTSSTTKQTTLSTTDSSKSYETTDCNSIGFFGNKNDCAKFYRCVENGGGKFMKYEYKCGDGTVWDPAIESCNHAWLVKSCGTHRFNATQDGIITQQSTGDIITTVSLIQTTTQKNLIDDDYNSGYQTIHSATPSQSITSTERITNQGSECKSPGFMSDSDCKKFYRCTENGLGGYTRHEFTCGEGTLWDSNIEACNHAWAVKTCGGSSINDNPVGSSPSIPEDDFDREDGYNSNHDNDKEHKNTVKTTTSSFTTNFVTPADNKGNECQSNGFMGNGNDCKIFYRCVENGNGGFIRYEFSCGDGTVWDPKITACNHASAVEKCGGSNSAHDYLSSSTEDPHLTTANTNGQISTQNTVLASSSTISTSTIENENEQCVAEGFTGDKKDCKKFYRCVNDGKGRYTRYEFSCGEGTVWDSKIQACNHASAVNSCGLNGSPDSDSTSATHPITIKDEETNFNPVTQNNQETVGSTDSNLVSSSTIKSTAITDNKNECTTEGFMGDSKDCKKFYRCVNDGKGSFIRYEFSCGDGTAWDSEINACNHVSSVNNPCSSVSVQIINEKEPNQTAVTSSPSGNNDYSTTSENPPKSQECEQEGFFGDKTDCKKFYRCTDNGHGGFQKYEFSCGEGTIWDQNIIACNHASSNAQCGLMDKEPQIDNSDLYSTTTSIETLQSTEKTESLASKDECTSEGFYANSNDCKKFFRCVGDGKGGFTRYDFTCGEGTIWVQDIQACDHDSDPSLCSKEATTTTTTPSDPSQEKPMTTVSTSTARSTTMDKPTMKDETLSESSSTSETSPAASTSTTASNQDLCEEAGYFGNSMDCKMFYRCVDNGKGGFTKYDFTCGDGTIWDQDITACNHPRDVSNPSCDNQGNATTATPTTKTTTTPENNETSNPTKDTSSTETATTQSSSQSSQSGSTSTSKPSQNNYTCNEAGFYADPYDCKKFYRCVDWAGDGKTFSIYHFDCGEGTIWDPNLQTCNHEESVYPPRDCSGTQSQTENTTTTKQEETTESSTTEGSTTTTQSTTQKPTTQSSTTTTEASSTTDQTSTQQSSTSDQTSSTQQSTTQSSTTEQSTTQKTTTEKSTTESVTTQQTTSEQSTPQQSTTEQSTTTPEQTTTLQSTTSEQTTTTTTQQTTTASKEETTTTTEQTTTSESTTSTTDQSTTPDQATTSESTEKSSTTTEQSTTQETPDGSTTTESGQDSTTEQQSSSKDCPETDDDQYVFVCPTGFKRHPKYCNLFYQCTEDDDSHEMKVAVFNCPNNTIYDESKTQCVEEDKADKKCDGQLAQRRRVKRLDANYKEPITVGREKHLCPAVGHFPFEKNEQCSPVLFKCQVSKSGKLRGFMYQCPEGYVYWSISRRCEPVSYMPECKHSTSNWKDRYEIPIERNNVARKAIK